MKKKNLLLSLLAFVVPSFFLLSCEPTLSSVSISEESMEGVEAEEAKFEDFSLFYVPERGGYLVGDYKGSLTTFAVPEEATGEDGVTAPIIGLADYAFYGRKGITTVLLGENVTTLGAHCFADTDITDLRVAGSLLYVDDDAFTGSKITFYKKGGIEYLPSWDYPYSTAFASKGTNYVSLEVWDVLLDPSCTHLVIEPGITEIEKLAFCHCSSLVSVAIPSSVTDIGQEAFYYCSSLVSIDIPSAVKSIGDGSFEYCSSLTSIEIPSSVYSIPDSTFRGCTSLVSVGIPSSVYRIGKRAFQDCSSLPSIEIPAKLAQINEYTFSGCSSLTSLEIPSTVTYIGKYAFADCSSLTSLEIPSSVTKLDECAFASCTSLGSLVIPSSLETIGERAFASCPSLESITVSPDNPVYDSRDNCNGIILTKYNILILGCSKTAIPSSVTAIGGYAFSGCTSLASINIPSSVTSINSYAFEGCSLTSIDIPFSVTSIGKGVFGGCTSLESITVSPDNPVYDSRNNCNAIIRKSDNALMVGCATTIIPSTVTSIGDYAFSDCISLTSIGIPSSVTSISKYAFSDCISLVSIDIPSSVTSIGENAFQNCSSLSSVAIPSSVTSIGDHAFFSCSSLKSIVIPSSVVKIGICVFSNCSSVTVYCQVRSKPEGWETSWYHSYDGDNLRWTKVTVVWGYKG